MNMKRPDCFGDLDRVFPMTPDGLRHSPEDCLTCNEKASCLKTAIAGDQQMVMASERLDRAYRAGTISFFQRWSKKKRIHKSLTDRGRSEGGANGQKT